MIETDVAVVGAGPAGLAAARAALSEGCRVSLLDDQDTPGGQYFRQPSSLLSRRAMRPLGTPIAKAEAVFDALNHRAMDYRPGYTVWNIPAPRVLAIANDATGKRLQAQTVIIAAGAHDRVRPFPGWTLPGVITAGGAQNLFKGQRILPGQRIVVAGNGPLLLAVSATLVSAGARIVAVADTARVAQRIPSALPGLLGVPGLLALAARYRLALWQSGVTVLPGHCVLEAHGSHAVSEVVLAPLDCNGEANRAKARCLSADTLIVGDGLQCSAELPRLAGCEMHYEPLEGGWYPVRDQWLTSTLSWLFLAGDGAGVAGADTAMVEGELSGLAAARRIRGGLSPRATRRAEQLKRRLARAGRARRALQQIFNSTRARSSTLLDDTVICRCEDVRWQQIHALIQNPMVDMAQLKSRTRAGMGRCQGRNCMANLVELAAQSRGVRPAQIPWPQSRAPARPVSIAALLKENVPPPVLPADPHLPRVRPAQEA